MSTEGASPAERESFSCARSSAAANYLKKGSGGGEPRLRTKSENKPISRRSTEGRERGVVNSRPRGAAELREGSRGQLSTLTVLTGKGDERERGAIKDASKIKIRGERQLGVVKVIGSAIKNGKKAHNGGRG